VYERTVYFLRYHLTWLQQVWTAKQLKSRDQKQTQSARQNLEDREGVKKDQTRRTTNVQVTDDLRQSKGGPGQESHVYLSSQTWRREQSLKRVETPISHRGTAWLLQTSMLDWMRQKFKGTGGTIMEVETIQLCCSWKQLPDQNRDSPAPQV
jgi:hypothetical protein